MHRPILKQLQRKQSLAAFLLILLLIFTLVSKVHAGQDDNQDEGADENYVIAGLILDSQDQPITEALVTASQSGQEEPLAETESQEDGNWALILTEEPGTGLTVTIERPHFEIESIVIDPTELAELLVTGTLGLGEITLQRRITAGFWIAAIIFVGLLLIIALEKLHSTTAALAGISAILLVTFAAVQRTIRLSPQSNL